jgi:hypothetical protein
MGSKPRITLQSPDPEDFADDEPVYIPVSS